MHIVIPMSGMGNRFVKAGYLSPKPLILVDNHPIIEHVVNLFPGETKFTFICNKLHDSTTDMRKTLLRLVPNANIQIIDTHQRGPVFAVLQIIDHIEDDEEVIVNYCDFGSFWDYPAFLQHTRERKADGAIAAYKGFHPHMLGDTNYAFIKEEKQWLLEIKEKEPFTQNRMEEFASNGTYYFRKGSLVKKYFEKLIELNIHVNGEYYVSLIYNLLVKDNLKVSIHEIQHMLQWGTPPDVEEYQRWSHYFQLLAKGVNPKLNIDPRTVNMIPLAGRGERFQKEGYALPKPLIPISGRPMIIQAAYFLPKTNKYRFICLKAHLDSSTLKETILKNFPHGEIMSLGEVSRGQASTCEFGLKDIDPEAPILIGACDNGMIWNSSVYQELIDDPEVDAIVWSFRNHPSSNKNPHMYGWLRTNTEKKVLEVSVKKAISQSPHNDQAIVGTFYFRKTKDFMDSIKNLYANNNTVNGEFYVDSCINELLALGKNVKYFEVDHYVCWGTPNDVRTYEYWQSFFHKCHWHPYDLRTDFMIEKKEIATLEKKYSTFSQKYL